MSLTLRLEVGVAFQLIRCTRCSMASPDAGCQCCCPDPFAFTRLWAVILVRKRNREKNLSRLSVIRHASQKQALACRLGKVEQEDTEACQGRGNTGAKRGLPMCAAGEENSRENPEPFSGATREIRTCLPPDTDPYAANCRITCSPAVPGGTKVPWGWCPCYEQPWYTPAKDCTMARVSLGVSLWKCA